MKHRLRSGSDGVYEPFPPDPGYVHSRLMEWRHHGSCTTAITVSWCLSSHCQNHVLVQWHCSHGHGGRDRAPCWGCVWLISGCVKNEHHSNQGWHRFQNTITPIWEEEYSEILNQCVTGLALIIQKSSESFHLFISPLTAAQMNTDSDPELPQILVYSIPRSTWNNQDGLDLHQVAHNTQWHSDATSGMHIPLVIVWSCSFLVYPSLRLGWWNCEASLHQSTIPPTSLLFTHKQECALVIHTMAFHQSIKLSWMICRH